MYKKNRLTTLDNYARCYILLQKYENLFPCKEAFYKGTIFKDLYKKYE